MIAEAMLDFPGGPVVKNLPANTGHVGSIPELRRSPGGGAGTRCNILAWESPWTEKLGRLQSLGSQRVRQKFSD